MLFVGAIPRDTASQTFRQLDMSLIEHAYICCSGSFRFEQAISSNFDHIPCHSNDVSLLTSAIGRLAAGDPMEFVFKDELSFLEGGLELIAKERGTPTTPVERCASLLVATTMCHFRGKNEYVRAHFKHYQDRAAHYIAKAATKLGPYIADLNVGSFYLGDFRDHADKAIENGGAVFAWPPLFKGDYERFYRLIHNNVVWNEPDYKMWNPKMMPDWLRHLDKSGVQYVVCSDQDFSGDHGIKPIALFSSGRTKRIFLYSSQRENSSYVRLDSKREAFRYKPIDTIKLTRNSSVSICPVDSKRMNYIKDQYQVLGLRHTTGMQKFLVLVDGMLAGGFVYDRMQGARKYSDPRLTTQTAIYLLSDFSCSRKRRLAKLIAMLATGREPVRSWDLRTISKVELLMTTARTKRPVSMKYRGIYDLLNRGDGVLNYISGVRDGTSQQIYEQWWDRWVEKPKGRGRGRGRNR